ncbi:MAG: tRNA dihydrouridine synthase DusB [Pseudomonadales bacterium]|nr:tRNA dihydrouridine synthase DusB [Pseudomonadales bacterium]
MPSIGPYELENKLILAPMAGVTDRPFRQLCRQQGAALAVSEMVISDTRFWNTRKSKFRLNHEGEDAPISVQIAGAEPGLMAEAARENVKRGAQIIDINMGCPAKKVCNKAAGSALMRDEPLVAEILKAVVNAVDVPVTLKMRTGWSPDHRNAVTIAKLAESIGIQALAIHGRTRSCGYTGNAEYDTIATVKQAVRIPVFANGDIDSPEKAKLVLDTTGADGLLIGRAAQGRPWIFNEINHYLATGEKLAPPSVESVRDILLNHIIELHAFYGELMGVRIARKHVTWYLKTMDDAKQFRKTFNTLEQAEAQKEQLQNYFETMIKKSNGEEKAA